MSSKAITFIFCLVIFSQSFGKQQPNIIIIVADDVGWNDFSFHGSNQIPTPNIDALAYNGVILNRFYTQHICTPSRAALLTGLYPIHTGMQGTPIPAGDSRHLPRDVGTLPQALKDLNYSTHLVGKWHLGAAYRKDLPTERGFDTHFGFWHGFVGYFNYIQAQQATETLFRGFDLHNGTDPAYEYDGRYATELFTQKSLDIIENHDRDKPLFLMISHLAGHTGDNSSELGVPDIDETNKKYSYIENLERRKYADVINKMDDSLGQVVEKLSEKQMLENSVILFLSDNGAPNQGMYANNGSNWPLRGMKVTLFEGGIRGSAILFSPLLEKQGYINNELMHITDIMPTFYHAAGGNVENLQAIDGVNQWPVLSNNISSVRSNILVNIDEYLKFSAYIGDNGRYKFMNSTFNNGKLDRFFGYSGRYEEVPSYNPLNVINSPTNKAIGKIKSIKELSESQILKVRNKLDLHACREPNLELPSCINNCLFDLENDPCETENLIGKMPDVAERLKRELDGYFPGIVPQKPTLIEDKANPIYYNQTWCTWLDDELCPKTDESGAHKVLAHLSHNKFIILGYTVLLKILGLIL